MKKDIITKTIKETVELGEKLGRRLAGGELIELTGDLGSGKTTFLKGLAKGIGIDQPISSPTFTISRVYKVGKKRFFHFDFYRIDSSDIVAMEIAEAAASPDAIVAVEWAEHIQDALPDEYLSVNLKAKDEHTRQVTLTAFGKKYDQLIGSSL